MHLLHKVVYIKVEIETSTLPTIMVCINFHCICMFVIMLELIEVATKFGKQICIC